MGEGDEHLTGELAKRQYHSPFQARRHPDRFGINPQHPARADETAPQGAEHLKKDEN